MNYSMQEIEARQAMNQFVRAKAKRAFTKPQRHGAQYPNPYPVLTHEHRIFKDEINRLIRASLAKTQPIAAIH